MNERVERLLGHLITLLSHLADLLYHLADERKRNMDTEVVLLNDIGTVARKAKDILGELEDIVIWKRYLEEKKEDREKGEEE